MAKKNFKLQKTNILPVDFTDRKGCGNDLVFYTTKGKVDFSRWMYIGIPKIEDVGNSKHADRNRLVFDLFNAIHQLSFESSKATIEVLAAEGCKQIFLFLDDLFLKGKTINSIDQFNRELIDQFLVWIRSKPAKTPSGRLSNSAARRHYTSIKTILLYFSRQGRISKEIFPYAPFVNVNKSGAGTEPYSKSEYSQIIKYLWQQLELIRCGKFEGTHRQKLAVYALAIAAKTGRNTSTILSLSKDCISPHPLAPDTQIILTGHKKRGMNTSVQAMKGSNNQEDIINANKSVEILIKEVIDHTSSIRSGREFAELFLITTDENIPSVFDDKYFWKAVQRIYERAELKNDSGGVLKIQVKRIRKTFAERIWQLTGGDPIKTAKMLGNTVPVMDKHYLDVTPEMEKNHKLFGHVLTETLLNQDGNLDSVVAKKLNISSTQANELL